MSFNRYRKKSVQERITEAHSHPCSNYMGNLSRVMTIGLVSLYDSINQKHNTKEAKPHITDEGFLQLNPKPIQATLLNRRYVHETLVATGTFAQIHLFKDLYTAKKVAIKITKAGCDLLSWREKAFLDHILHCEKRGASFFARISDIFLYEGHVCLAMPFYGGTLMDYVHESLKQKQLLSSHNNSTTSTPNIAKSTFSPKYDTTDGTTLELLQPRAIRSALVSSHAKQLSSSSHMKIANSKSMTILREFTRSDMVALKRIALQLLSALWLLQKEEIIHGDLKPENCFLDFSRSTALNNISDSRSRYASSLAPSIVAGSIDIGSSPVDGRVSTNEPSIDRSKWGSPIAIDSSGDNRIALSLSQFPADAKVKLGDFGNSLHLSEIHQYFEEFEIQSLPYRAPEVLLGLRFNSAIDMWSLGIMLIELIIGQTLFHCRNREEAIRDVENHICKLSKTRFSSGKYAHLLFQAARFQGSSPGFAPSLAMESSQWNRSEQTKSIKRLLLKHTSFQSIPTYEIQTLIDFLTSLTAVDPSHRISPFDALQHNFLVEEINLPMGVVIQTAHEAEDIGSSSTRVYKRRRVTGGNPPFHSWKNF